MLSRENSSISLIHIASKGEHMALTQQQKDLILKFLAVSAQKSILVKEVMKKDNQLYENS
jgi:hypothetical protein